MNRSALPYLALALTSIVWGTTWVVSKIGILSGIHPLFFSALRQLVAGSCYLIFFLARGKARWPNLSQWGYLLLMAILLFVSSNGLTTWGVKYINSGLAAIIGAVFPLFVAIIDYSIGARDKPNAISFIGLVLGFAGVAIIFYEHIADFGQPAFRFGIGLSVFATLTWAVGTTITTRKKVALDSYYALGWQMFIAGSILTLISIGTGISLPLKAVPATVWYCLIYMVLFGSIFAFGAFIYTLKRLPPTLASIYAYINPMVAVVLGHFVLQEAWSFYLLAGALVTLIGVYLVNSGFRLAGQDGEITFRSLWSGRRY